MYSWSFFWLLGRPAHRDFGVRESESEHIPRGRERPEDVSIIGEPAEYTYDGRQRFVIQSVREIRVGTTAIRLENGEIFVGNQALTQGGLGPHNYVLDEHGAVTPGFLRAFD